MKRRLLLGVAPWALLAGQVAAQPGPSGGALGRQYPPLGPAGGLGFGTRPGPGAAGGPTLDLNFLVGAVDSRITTTRAAGGATYFDATNTLQLASANTARIDYGTTPSGVTNWITNSVQAGVVDGTPGTAPTSWTVSTTGSAITRTITQATVDGIAGVIYRYVGTPSATSAFFICMLTAAAQPASNGQTWTQSYSVQLVSGSVTNLAITNALLATDSAGSGVTNLTTSTLTPTATLTRTSATGTASSSLTAFMQPRIRLGFTISLPIDISIFVAQPQLELSASMGAYVPTSGTAANSGATPLGLLIEESRVNSIRNPRGEGSVIGSPGTLPTNWFVGGAGTTQVIGSGSESGIPYVDIRFATTASSTLAGLFEFANIIAAVSGQLWTSSVYVRLTAGTLTNVTSLEVSARAYSSAANGVDPTTGFLAQQFTAFTPTSAALSTQRAITTGYTMPATTAFVSGGLRITVNGAYDFTLRIGAPQLELGSFATSAILPAAASPAATTRAADNVSMVVGSWYNPATGTLLADGSCGNISATSTYAVLSDGTAANRFRLGRISGASAAVFYDSTVASVGNTFVSGGSFASMAAVKIAQSYNGGNFNGAANGSTATLGASTGTAIANITTLSIGNNVGGQHIDGYIRRVRYWPRALSNTELQLATL